MTFCQQLGCEVKELNVQADHIHLLVEVPPKVSISRLMGILKGRTAIRVFNEFSFLRKKPYWGNHFWAEGYCVDTVGLDGEMIRKYVKYQEKEEMRQEQLWLEESSGPSRKGRCDVRRSPKNLEYAFPVREAFLSFRREHPVTSAHRMKIAIFYPSTPFLLMTP
jgi:putative transposase